MIDQKLVAVGWIDSCTASTGWIMKSDWAETTPVDCVSVGFLIKEELGPEGYVEVAQSIGDPKGKHEQYCSRIVIPNRSIKAIKILGKDELDTLTQ